MTADTKIISLNKARKSRAKAAGKVQADANAARFGRTKTEKATDTAEAERRIHVLDAHRREPD